MRERELKQYLSSILFAYWLVAPHAGARIETRYRALPNGAVESLPMRERELKLFNGWFDVEFLRRSPCGSAN